MKPYVQVLQTARLNLRWLETDDAAFILRLVNEPSWLRFIGDKGIRTVKAARKYIRKGPVAMYRRLGFGLYLVELKDNGEPIGICGLIKREWLEDVDLGFAFLPAFWGKGYAFESATAVMDFGRRTFGVSRLLAVTSQDNEVSAKLLEKLGFHFERLTRLAPDAAELKVFAVAGARLTQPRHVDSFVPQLSRPHGPTCLFDSNSPVLGLRPCFARLCRTAPAGSIHSLPSGSALAQRRSAYATLRRDKKPRRQA